jgi:predicted transcriptional regulator
MYGDALGGSAMIPEIQEIRHVRRELGLTQKELAGMAGVSQSLIAKIEGGLVQPSYLNVKKLIEVLEREKNRRHPPVPVGKVCARNIVWCESHETVREAAALMRKHGFSQLPVRRKGAPVGSITDRLLSEALTAERPEAVALQRVEEIMGDPFPQLPETTPLKVASTLLQYAPAVMVMRESEPVGMLTKADLLKVLAAESAPRA